MSDYLAVEEAKEFLEQEMGRLTGEAWNADARENEQGVQFCVLCKGYGANTPRLNPFDVSIARLQKFAKGTAEVKAKIDARGGKPISCHICQKPFNLSEGGSVTQRRGYLVAICSDACKQEVGRQIQNEARGIMVDYWYPDGAL